MNDGREAVHGEQDRGLCRAAAVGRAGLAGGRGTGDG